jgi:hypothetical protein
MSLVCTKWFLLSDHRHQRAIQSTDINEIYYLDFKNASVKKAALARLCIDFLLLLLVLLIE